MPYHPLLMPFGKSLILIGAVAGAYFVLGLLGLLFRFPTDPVGMIMPSAGLALAATLLFGVQILPAVAIGNFCVNAWFFNFAQGYLAYYIASGVGAAFSAWVGSRLVRRLVGFPDPLVEARKILLFFCVAVPLSSLLSAVIGITAMFVSGMVLAKQMALAGLSWWSGDILGVLIFTPLILLLFAEPNNIWYRRRKTVGFPIILTFALVVLLFFYLRGVDRQLYAEQLKGKATNLSENLKNRIQLDLQSLHAIRAFLLASQALEPKEVLLLANQTISSFKEIKLISWINLMKKIEGKSRAISVLSERQANKPETLPVIPPDLRRKILGSPSFYESEFLISENDGFKFIIPVIKELNQERNTIGVIIAAISMEDLIHHAIGMLNIHNCSMTISVRKGDDKPKIIYANTGYTDYSAYESIAIPVADQAWLLSFYHDWSKENTGTNWPTGLIAFSGLWFTGILGMVLLQLTGRNFLTETIISERTKILTETKTAAEQANQAKNQFLAKISHELRTPLNGISGFTQLLEKKPTLNAEDKKQVAIIKQCSDDLLRLINDILDISAIETQQIKLEISDFNFALLLADSIQLCKFRADEKGLKLLSKNNCVPRKFLGDEKRIRQILVNLIDNAVKYTDQGSVTVTAFYQGGIMKISVADTGTGIAQKDMERIFSPFVQVNVDNFTREGIGLGLSITKELVHLMDGDVAVASQLGVGSIFTVSLPLPVTGISQVKVTEELRNEAENLTDSRVLVVDDSEVNLIFLVSMLEQLGCQVDSAMDGQRALVLIEQNRYRFALIDINMPVMNGLELVKRLRSQQCKLKLVSVSAYADDAKIKEALSAGFDAYITKPIEEFQLVELIRASKN
jgi:signal transduction histidine kinase/CheY-like chemotaxis protein